MTYKPAGQAVGLCSSSVGIEGEMQKAAVILTREWKRNASWGACSSMCAAGHCLQHGCHAPDTGHVVCIACLGMTVCEMKTHVSNHKQQ